MDESVSYVQDETTIGDEISSLPLGERLTLIERLGTKTYKRVVEQCGDVIPSHSRSQLNKREHKKRPREQSSKVPVPLLRNVFDNSANSKTSVSRRDPRFDPKSGGQFRQDVFDKQYNFISDLRTNEKKELKKILAEEDNSERREQLEFLLERMGNQEKSYEAANKRREKLQELKRQNRERLKAGKKPIFVTRASVKNSMLEEQYAELQKKGKLKKYLDRKNRKRAMKKTVEPFDK